MTHNWIKPLEEIRQAYCFFSIIAVLPQLVCNLGTFFLLLLSNIADFQPRISQSVSVLHYLTLQFSSYWHQHSLTTFPHSPASPHVPVLSFSFAVASGMLLFSRNFHLEKYFHLNVPSVQSYNAYKFISFIILNINVCYIQF